MIILLVIILILLLVILYWLNCIINNQEAVLKNLASRINELKNEVKDNGRQVFELEEYIRKHF